MGEIANLLETKVGLSPDKAQQAEQVVVEHLTSKVPSQYQGLLGSVLGTGGSEGSGDAAGSSGFGGILEAASGFFGKKE